MLSALELADAQLDSLLGRTSPIVKLGVAIGWLVGLAFTLEPGAPARRWPSSRSRAGIVARRRSGSATWRGRSRRSGWRRSASACSTRCSRPATGTRPRRPLFTLGPFRITERRGRPTASRLALRVVAIASVGAVFALTTDPTRLVDALVQQARVARAVRLRRAGRLPGDPALRRGPRHAAPGAPDPRPARVVASAAARRGCWSSRSATATAWRWRWTRAPSGRGRGPAYRDVRWRLVRSSGSRRRVRRSSWRCRRSGSLSIG